LLAEKLEVAKRSLKNTIEDLEFLREQVTVMEVNFARVHNVSLGSIAHTMQQSNSYVMTAYGMDQWDVKR
jgi:DNA-binding transcriptional regulator YiaG